MPEALIAAIGIGFKVRGVTGRDGRAELLLRDRERMTGLVAWRPTLSIQCLRDVEKGPPRGASSLTLLPREAWTFRVVDPENKPVQGLDLAVIARTEDSAWIHTGEVEAARLKTGADLSVVVP